MDVLPSPPALSYPDGGQQTPAALQAIKQLVRLLLAREDASLLEPLAPLPRAGPALLASLGELPAVDLLATIRRQRLECLLHGDPYVAELLPALWLSLQHLARRETMAALALASLTREISRLLQQAQIPVLVIKGVPLALQTTSSIAARGRGDLDLFVDPMDVARTVELLIEDGFLIDEACYHAFAHDSILGRYYRWTFYELTLQRTKGGVRQFVDLHWRLDISRCRPLPCFRKSYANCEYLPIGESLVCTLNLNNAFLHACAHAAKDNWMCLRNLVDIHRLAVRLKPEAFLKMQYYQYISFSCAATYEVTGGPILARVDQNRTWGDRCLVKATAHQLVGWRQQPHQYIHVPRFVVLLSSDFGPGWNGWKGRLAEFMWIALPPNSLINPKTGQVRLPPLGYFFSRLLSYLRRLSRSNFFRPRR